jgi:hypothetical protein
MMSSIDVHRVSFCHVNTHITISSCRYPGISISTVMSLSRYPISTVMSRSQVSRRHIKYLPASKFPCNPLHRKSGATSPSWGVEGRVEDSFRLLQVENSSFFRVVGRSSFVSANNNGRPGESLGLSTSENHPPNQ